MLLYLFACVLVEYRRLFEILVRRPIVTGMSGGALMTLAE